MRRFPVIEIRMLKIRTCAPSSMVSINSMCRLHHPNAVSNAMTRYRVAEAAARLAIAAIGPGSVRNLRRFGVGGVVAPAGRSTVKRCSSLPQLGELRRRVVVLPLEAGRELLAIRCCTRRARRVRRMLSPARSGSLPPRNRCVSAQPARRDPRVTSSEGCATCSRWQQGRAGARSRRPAFLPLRMHKRRASWESSR